ncbi:hypothetical protein [Ammoniphilus sp. YIM 78166]|uniref:hypothetical protein n=1 Tax=Ammoniphilus sp. YIM 78166 TaxID=1644106 RepID=UPI00107015D5|nr:hypothetical protein [Ammoniphilus sp. YIM 78166]
MRNLIKPICLMMVLVLVSCQNQQVSHLEIDSATMKQVTNILKEQVGISPIFNSNFVRVSWTREANEQIPSLMDALLVTMEPVRKIEEPKGLKEDREIVKAEYQHWSDKGFLHKQIIIYIPTRVEKPHDKIIMMISDENFKSQYFLLKSNEKETKKLLNWVKKRGLFN